MIGSYMSTTQRTIHSRAHSLTDLRTPVVKQRRTSNHHTQKAYDNDAHTHELCSVLVRFVPRDMCVAWHHRHHRHHLSNTHPLEGDTVTDRELLDHDVVRAKEDGGHYGTHPSRDI